MDEMSKLVGIELQTWFPRPSATSSMNRRLDDDDGDELMKVIMQPNRKAYHPEESNDPSALLGNPARIGATGTIGINLGAMGGTANELISSTGRESAEPIQATKDFIVEENGAVRPSSGDAIGVSLVDDELFKKFEISSPSFGENNPSSDNAVAASAGASIKLDLENLYHHRWFRNFDPNMDPKKLRRILRNRLSVQKNRSRQLENLAQLEQQLNDLKESVTLMASLVSENKYKQNELNIENDAIRNRIATISDEQRLKCAEYDLLKQVKRRLLDIHRQQQQQKSKLLDMENSTSNLAAWEFGQEQLFNFKNPMYQADFGFEQEKLCNVMNPVEYELKQEQLFNINKSMNQVEFGFGQQQLFNINNPRNQAEQVFNVNCQMNIDEHRSEEGQLFDIYNLMNMAEFNNGE